jgi:hypothetical protein
MPPLPRQMITVLHPFAGVFRTRVWHRAVVLVVGALLKPGQRTVSAVSRPLKLVQSGCEC